MSARSRTNLLAMEESVIQESTAGAANEYGSIKQSFGSGMTSIDSIKENGKRYKRKKRLEQAAIIAVAVLLSALVAFGAAMIAVNVSHGDSTAADEDAANFGPESDTVTQNAKETSKSVCAPSAEGDQQVFSGLDFSVFGYNILSAYPFAFGHDPGLTHPIFLISYDQKKKTADCAYSVPDGMDVVRDIACATSFDSSIMTSRQEFDKALSTSVEASFGGFGFSFSASTQYKSESQQLSTGENIMIMTGAKCQQFFTQIDEFKPPPFHPSFLGWIQKLQNTTDDRDYLEFIQYYGTHFVSEAAFGARFMYSYSMTKSTYHSMQSKGVNVAVAASYSGLFFHAGGKFSFSESTKSVIDQFSQKVSTKTISQGTPPPLDLNATKWANQAFKNPVPISYKVLPLDLIFTDKFMGRLPAGIDVDYSKIRNKLLHIMNVKYRSEVFDRSSNLQCRTVNHPVRLPDSMCFKSNLVGSKLLGDVKSSSGCHGNCLEERDCLVAMSGMEDSPDCHVLHRMSYDKGEGLLAAQGQQKCDSYVFPYRQTSNFGLSNQPSWLTIKGVVAVETGLGKWSNLTATNCKTKCSSDIDCVAYSIKVNRCGIFTQSDMQMVELTASPKQGDMLGFIKDCT